MAQSWPAILLIVALNMRNIFQGGAYKPEFDRALDNLTVARGRDAMFTCYVKHLGGYRVGWVKSDTKAIQAIHEHVITHNPRVSVSHNDHNVWNLHIHNVQEEDSGQYMCQINTNPMDSQLGFLNVVVPPDIINEESSGDVMVPEGGIVKLTCRARGVPEPRITWRREDGAEIVIKESGSQAPKIRKAVVEGSELKLTKITRSEMGAYLCIASNTVPPSVSKRITVNVNFNPVIHVPNQLVGAPLGTDVTLECFVEASPKAINYWVRTLDGQDRTSLPITGDEKKKGSTQFTPPSYEPGTGATQNQGEMVLPNEKYSVQIHAKSLFETKMTLFIRNLQLSDVGTYKCVAKNSLGEVESAIRLYDIPGPTRGANPPDAEDFPESEVSVEDEAPLDVDETGTGVRTNVPFDQDADDNSIKSPSPSSTPTGNRRSNFVGVAPPRSARATATVLLPSWTILTFFLLCMV